MRTLVDARWRGIVLQRAAPLLRSTRTPAVVVGAEAKKMIGRTPGHCGVLLLHVRRDRRDFDTTGRMLRYFIQKVHVGPP